MQFICVVSASYTIDKKSRFSLDKKSLVSVSVERQNFETIFFVFSFMEKMLIK